MYIAFFFLNPGQNYHCHSGFLHFSVIVFTTFLPSYSLSMNDKQILHYLVVISQLKKKNSDYIVSILMSKTNLSSTVIFTQFQNWVLLLEEKKQKKQRPKVKDVVIN